MEMVCCCCFGCLLRVERFMHFLRSTCWRWNCCWSFAFMGCNGHKDFTGMSWCRDARMSDKIMDLTSLVSTLVLLIWACVRAVIELGFEPIQCLRAVFPNEFHVNRIVSCHHKLPDISLKPEWRRLLHSRCNGLTEPYLVKSMVSPRRTAALICQGNMESGENLVPEYQESSSATPF